MQALQTDQSSNSVTPSRPRQIATPPRITRKRQLSLSYSPKRLCFASKCPTSHDGSALTSCSTRASWEGPPCLATSRQLQQQVPGRRRGHAGEPRGAIREGGTQGSAVFPPGLARFCLTVTFTVGSRTILLNGDFHRWANGNVPRDPPHPRTPTVKITVKHYDGEDHR